MKLIEICSSNVLVPSNCVSENEGLKKVKRFYDEINNSQDIGYSFVVPYSAISFSKLKKGLSQFFDGDEDPINDFLDSISGKEWIGIERFHRAIASTLIRDKFLAYPIMNKRDLKYANTLDDFDHKFNKVEDLALEAVQYYYNFTDGFVTTAHDIANHLVTSQEEDSKRIFTEEMIKKWRNRHKFL